MQLLGFAALIIAGVSQRFVPLVYGLKPPKRDRQSLIFAFMNVSLLLNMISYVAVLTTGNLMLGGAGDRVCADAGLGGATRDATRCLR